VVPARSARERASGRSSEPYAAYLDASTGVEERFAAMRVFAVRALYVVHVEGAYAIASSVHVSTDGISMCWKDTLRILNRP
jgi:hypothetical protein